MGGRGVKEGWGALDGPDAQGRATDTRPNVGDRGCRMGLVGAKPMRTWERGAGGRSVMAVLVIAWKDLPRWDVDGQELCREGKKRFC